MSGWWPDERRYAGAEHLDAGYVAGYDRKSGFDPTDDVEVLRRRGLDAGSTVVDLGAGTGTFTVAVAPWSARVVAVDVSPVMADALRRRVDDLGLANVEVVEAGFLSYRHVGEPADVVFTRNALHQLPDLWKGVALARVAGYLRPGGVLRLHDLAFDSGPDELPATVEGWLAGAVADPGVGYTAGELAEHLRGEFSTYSWLLDALLDRSGFDVEDRHYRRGAYGAYTCRRRA